MKAMDDKFRAAQTKLYMTVAESGLVTEAMSKGVSPVASIRSSGCEYPRPRANTNSP